MCAGKQQSRWPLVSILRKRKLKDSYIYLNILAQFRRGGGAYATTSIFWGGKGWIWYFPCQNFSSLHTLIKTLSLCLVTCSRGALQTAGVAIWAPEGSWGGKADFSPTAGAAALGAGRWEAEPCGLQGATESVTLYVFWLGRELINNVNSCCAAVSAGVRPSGVSVERKRASPVKLLEDASLVFRSWTGLCYSLARLQTYKR